tara:strand:+ start:633 stop:1487 length:855 start_codon:yes stop_codon:yes gene_type:complete
MSIKFGFVTSVKLGLSCMEEIYRNNGKLEIAISLNDDLQTNNSGRVYIDNFCEEKNIKLLKCQHINDDECIDLIKSSGIDWLFIIGWSQIASNKVLEAPKKGAIGMHPTLLPVGRGRASIPWAIIHKEKYTGVTMFKLDEGVDTGLIIAQEKIKMKNNIDAGYLYEQVNKAHISLMENAYPKLVKDNFKGKKQDESLATYWPGRKPEDGEIDVNGSVQDAEVLIRAVTKPYPGAFYWTKEGKKRIVWSSEVVKNTNDSGKYLEFNDGILKLIEFEDINVKKKNS